MVEPLAQQVIRHLDRLPSLYHRLVLVVGPSGSGKTSALQEAQEHTDSFCILDVHLDPEDRSLALKRLTTALRRRIK